MSPAAPLRTARRARIGAAHGWPLGLQALSAALEGVPQAAELRVEFSEPDMYALRQGGPFTVLDLRFFGATASVFRARGSQLPRMWQLLVRAVPREAKPPIAEALPAALEGVVRPWLLRLGALEGREGEALLRLAWGPAEARLVASPWEQLLPVRSCA